MRCVASRRCKAITCCRACAATAGAGRAGIQRRDHAADHRPPRVPPCGRRAAESRRAGPNTTCTSMPPSESTRFRCGSRSVPPYQATSGRCWRPSGRPSMLLIGDGDRLHRRDAAVVDRALRGADQRGAERQHLVAVARRALREEHHDVALREPARRPRRPARRSRGGGRGRRRRCAASARGSRRPASSPPPSWR